MITKQENTFNSVSFFRAVKEKMAEMMQGMTLAQKKEFMQQIREGKIKVSVNEGISATTI